MIRRLHRSLYTGITGTPHGHWQAANELTWSCVSAAAITGSLPVSLSLCQSDSVSLSLPVRTAVSLSAAPAAAPRHQSLSQTADSLAVATLSFRDEVGAAIENEHGPPPA